MHKINRREFCYCHLHLSKAYTANNIHDPHIYQGELTWPVFPNIKLASEASHQEGGWITSYCRAVCS